MRFSFKLELDKQELTFEVERIYRNKQIERFRVSLTGGAKSFIVQWDKPNIEAKKLNKAVQWQMVEGYLNNPHTLQLIYQEIESGIANQLPPFQGTLNFNTLL